MSLILLAFGLVLVVEGLALALAPSRIEQVLAKFSAMPIEARRYFGLAALALGVGVLALVRWLGVTI